MLIRSQNKEKLMKFGISFNGIEYGAEENHKKNDDTVKHVLYISDGCLEVIAEYKTKERCLEVMDDIQKSYERRYTVYELPEE